MEGVVRGGTPLRNVHLKPGRELPSKRVHRGSSLVLKWFPKYDFESVTVAAWSLSLGVLSPRVNVVVTAINISINLGYKKIKVVGVDMDRIKDLEVDQESNSTGIRIDYFYNDNEKPFFLQHKLKDHQGLPVHIKLMRESSTFKWFALVNAYSKNRGVNLCNASEYSWIDSIDRCEL